MRGTVRCCLFVCCIFTLSVDPALGATIHVPGDLPTIQGAILDAGEGDLVLVAPGTYVESLDFLGKGITLRSEGGADATVINGDNEVPVVTFANQETDAAVIDGFTIRNGRGASVEYLPGLWYHGGGGVFVLTSTPTITNCAIVANAAGSNGGGIACVYEAHATITNCTIAGNGAIRGGGIDCYDDSSPLIENCIITDNDSTCGCSGGGAIHFYGSSPVIRHCTITGNRAVGNGGAFYIRSSSPTVTNCILWGDSANTSPEVHVISGDPTITYSDIAFGYVGEGNIDVDPFFIAPGDFHLEARSPCIDAGTDAGSVVDMDGDGRPWGGGFDMGADEYADLDGDGWISWEDCDDTDPAVNPDVIEGPENPGTCADGVDNDCDGLIDTDPGCGATPCTARTVPAAQGPAAALWLIPVLVVALIGRRLFR